MQSSNSIMTAWQHTLSFCYKVNNSSSFTSLFGACVLSHVWLCTLCLAPLSMGFFQARILEWVAISSFRGSSWPRDQIHISWVSCLGRRVLYHYCQALLLLRNHCLACVLGRLPWVKGVIKLSDLSTYTQIHTQTHSCPYLYCNLSQQTPCLAIRFTHACI